MQNKHDEEDLKKKNFGLSETEFDALRLGLIVGDDELFEKIYLSHFEKCMKYLQSQFKASKDQSYDATMEALLNFRRAIILDKFKYGNLSYLFTRMAYFQMLKKKKDIKDFTAEEMNLFQISSVTIDNQEHEQRLTSLEEAVSKLNSEQQALLNNYYYKKLKLKDIAEKEGVPDATVRKRKERLLDYLKGMLTKQS